MRPVLEVSGLSRISGGLRPGDLDLRVDADELWPLIGPNGAGKTTFFNCVTGILHTPTEGKMFLRRRWRKASCSTAKKPHVITTMGMARTFQNIRLFSDMTVLENVMGGPSLPHPRGHLGRAVA